MTLHVETIGDGPPLLLLHGWGFHSSVWDGFAQPLAQRHRVQMIDLPGHGHSTEAPFTDLDTIVDEIAPKIPDRTIACGWSMGGLVAQRLAIRHPLKVRALALMSTTPCFTKRRGWRHGTAQATLAQFARGLRDQPKATLKTFVTLNALDIPGARSTVRDLMRRLDERPAPSRKALDAGLEMLRTIDLRNEARTIAVPTVVIHGALDRIVAPGAGTWLTRAIRGARGIELPDAAHLPFVTHGNATLEALRLLDD
jgi:pimeloyl-[acyl-carrier protein] methyl ester esterase